MIGRGPEVERRAVAGVVARVRQRVRARAAEQWQRELERVRRNRRVDVEIAEKDLPSTRRRGACLRRRARSQVAGSIVASQAVIFLTYLLWMSRVAWSMSVDRNLPGWLSRLHPKYGTPYRVLWLYALVYSVMVALPFEALLVADIWVSGAYTMILLATLVRARRQARADDGFRVPLGNTGLWLTVLVPAFTWVVFLGLTWQEHALMGVGLLLIGPVLWVVGQKVLGFRPAAVSRTAT